MMKKRLIIRLLALLFVAALLLSLFGCLNLPVKEHPSGENEGQKDDETKKDDPSGNKDPADPVVHPSEASSVYDNVFVAELGKKYEYLCNTKEPKLVVIGGSSVAFGLDSEMLSRYTGKAAVNFGLYATLGSKVMLDLSEEGLYRGDTVIFAPELDAQALSLYFGAKSAWQAIDVYPELYDVMAKRNAGDLASAYERYLEDKAECLEDGKPNPSGVYNSQNFNRYGDVVYDRVYNTMLLGYDPNTLFSLTESIVSEDFIRYFNTYVANMKDRGVTVYFSFCPINSLSLAEGTDDESILAFENYLKSKLACPVISSLSDYVMDWGYFYDTNLHLNEAGVTVRTANLIADYCKATGTQNEYTAQLPKPTGFEDSDPGEDDPEQEQYADCFLYREEYLPGGGVAGLSIIGVSETGKKLKDRDVTIPSSSDGVPIIRICAAALKDMENLTILRLNANIRYLDDGVFEGCSKLHDVYLNFGADHCIVTTPDLENPTGLMTNAPDTVTFYCPEEYKADYQNDYTWGHYYKFFG